MGILEMIEVATTVDEGRNSPKEGQEIQTRTPFTLKECADSFLRSVTLERAFCSRYDFAPEVILDLELIGDKHEKQRCRSGDGFHLCNLSPEGPVLLLQIVATVTDSKRTVSLDAQEVC